MRKLFLLISFLIMFAFVGCALKDPGSQYDLAPSPGFRMGDKGQLTTLAAQDKLLVEDYSDASKTKHTTMANIDTYLSVIYQPLTAHLTDLADGNITSNFVNTAYPWVVNEGGTGAATFTDGGILLGSGTGAITALGVASNGQIPIGDNTTDPVLATITGTANEITVTNGAGSITLSLASEINATKIADGTVTSAEYQYINSLSSNAQDQFDARCLESVFGISLKDRLALNGTALDVSAVLEKYHGIDPSADVLILLGSANNTIILSNIGAEIGVDVQAYDADLTTYAGITPSADVQAALASANDTALRTEIGCGTAATKAADQDLESTDDVIFNKITATNGISTGASSNPVVRFLDSGCPGSDKFTGHVNMPYVRGNDGNETAWIYLRCMEDGSNVTQMIYNGNETIWELDGNFLELPNGTADVALPQVGAVHFNETDEQLSLHSGTNGEISGEASISLIYHRTWSFDPDAVCDGAVDRLFLMTIGDDAPEGIIIDEWKVSFEADPTTEADLDFKRADAFIGVASAAVMDVCDTTNGTSSEDTDANINAGAAVANGKVIYLEFGTAYTETTHQIIFEFWYHCEED